MPSMAEEDIEEIRDELREHKKQLDHTQIDAGV